MTKDWNLYKSKIKDLYFHKKFPLNRVKEHMSHQYGFEASVRAYRIKIDEWGLRKYGKAAARKSKSTHLLLDSSEVSLSNGTRTPLRAQIEEVAELDTSHCVSQFHNQASCQPIVLAPQKDHSDQGFQLSHPLSINKEHTNVTRTESHPFETQHLTLILNRANEEDPPSTSTGIYEAVENHGEQGTNTPTDDRLGVSLFDTSLERSNNRRNDPNDILRREDQGCLFEAVKAGDAAQVRTLLKSSTLDIASVDESGMQAIHWAAMGDKDESEEICRLLLQNGASPTARSRYGGRTPLHFDPPRRTLKLLLEGTSADDVDPVDEQGNTPMLHLLSHSVPSCGWSFLQEGANEFRVRMRLLLQAGANPNHRNLKGETTFEVALSLQIRLSTLDLVPLELFLEKGAHIISKIGVRDPLTRYSQSIHGAQTLQLKWRQRKTLFSFLLHGANGNELQVINGLDLIKYCTNALTFVLSTEPNRVLDILSVIRILWKSTWLHLLDRSTFLPLLKGLVWSLPYDLPLIETDSIDCLKELLEVFKLRPPPFERTHNLDLCQFLQHLSRFSTAKVLEIIKLCIDAGLTMFTIEELSPAIYSALRFYHGKLQQKLVELLLRKYLESDWIEPEYLGDSAASDSLWFFNWKKACRFHAMSFIDQEPPLPRYLNQRQKDVFLKFSRAILASECLMDA